jgi:hypothetical protein
VKQTREISEEGGGKNMKKKHENTIFPSSPDVPLFFHVFKFVLAKYQNEILLQLVTSYT